MHPAPSSVALAFARLGLPWDGAVVRSCHAGDAARVATEVARADVAAVLTGPDAPPEAVGAALVALGAHHRLVVVATRLGEPGERVVRCTDLADLAAGRFDHRSVVVVAHPAAARPAAGRGGRPVAAFAHRASMITKPEVRSIVLGKLSLPERGVLWDVGAGSGSVAIEAALAAPGLRVIAVERNHDDAERVLANAAALGALVDVVEGAAPAALEGLPAPDRVFVGGGGLDVLDACLAALRPSGRLVATFAAVDRAVAAHRLLGNLVQVGVDRAEALPDGGVRFAADNPVFVAWGDATGAPDGRSAGGRIVVGVGCSSDASADDLAAVVADALAAGGATKPGTVDAGPLDAGPLDAGPLDAGPLDSDTLDGGTVDGGTVDGGTLDGGTLDAGPLDAGPLDAGPLDAGPLDAGPLDAGPLDGGTLDSGTLDAGPLDAGTLAIRADHPAVRADADGAADDRRSGSGTSSPVSSRDRVDGGPADRTSVDVATIDVRADHPAVRAAATGRGRLLAFPSSLLGVVDVPNPSEVVAEAVGTPSVAEAAAILGAGPGGRLIVPKRKNATATAAVAASTTEHAGSVHIVGLGPGGGAHRTPAATAAIRHADAIVGYGPYVDSIVPLLSPDQLVFRGTMGAEADRALAALALARAGWRVALVSSGDPGVFAMAARTLDLAGDEPDVDIRVVPGVTAAHAAAAAAGAPLGGAHALVTLSDLLVPWTSIEAHLRAAASSGMALALYNPRSAGRADHLARARDVLAETMDPSTPVVVVTDATGAHQSVVRTTLSDLDPTVVGMRSMVLIGGRP